jgi:hypothetical protein
MKKLATALCITVVGLSSLASAGDYAVYSSAEYCELNRTKATQLDERYLKAYAKKLGSVPNKQLCKNIHLEQFASQDTTNYRWSYFQNKPYQGSIIRLSDIAISLLKSEDVDANEIFE